MNLVTEEQPAALALACPIGIAVMRRAAFRAVWRRPAARWPNRTLHQCGIDQRPAPELQTRRIELPRHLGKQRLAKPGSLQIVAEPAKGGLAGRPHPAPSRKTDGTTPDRAVPLQDPDPKGHTIAAAEAP